MRWRHTAIVIFFAFCFNADIGWGQERNVQDAMRLHRRMQRLSAQGHYTEAARIGEQAVEVLENTLGPDHPDTVTALNNLAQVYHNLGNYTKALPLAQRVLTTLEKRQGATHPDTARALNNLASLHSDMGDYAQALLLYQRALMMFEQARGPGHPDTATALNSLGTLYEKMGDYAQALPLLQRALQIWQHALGPHHLDTTFALTSLGGVYLAMGDATQALSAFQRALQIREQALEPGHPDIVIALHNLAGAYNSTGNHIQALPLLQRLMTLSEQTLGPDHPDLALVLSNLALSYGKEEQYTQALSLLQRALEIWQRTLGPHHPYTALALINLAGAYDSLGQHAQALPLLQRTLQIWQQTLGPNHPNTATTLVRLAWLSTRLGDYTQALQFFQRGLAARNRIIANVFSVTPEEQKLRFIAESHGEFYTALSLVQQHFSRDIQALRFGLEMVLQRKSLVLDVQSQAQQAFATRLEGETLLAWQRLLQHRSTLSRLLLHGSGSQSPADYQWAVENLFATIAQEEQILTQHSGIVAQTLFQQQVTAQIVAARLPQDSALIEFVRLKDWNGEKNAWLCTERYLAFVLTPDNRVTLADLGEATQIESMITTTLAHINASTRSSDVQASTHQVDIALANLYKQLLQPLEAALSGVVRLIVSPDSELNKVPFAALRVPDGHYLIETRRLSYVASGRDLLRSKTSESPSSDLLLVVNPAFDDQEALRTGTASIEARQVGFTGNFAPLPGTAEEAQRILPLVKGVKKVLEGSQATESAVRSTTSPRILHLATHGFFLQNQTIAMPRTPSYLSGQGSVPRRDLSLLEPAPVSSVCGQPVDMRISSMARSGLALAGANAAGTVNMGDDGLLTALEVSGMQLYGTELVVLSACQTAVGGIQSGEGVYGLRRAFTLAGAKNLVMSLWPVSDAATVNQMQHFYQAYGQGASATDALRQAQLHTIIELRTRTQKELGEALAPVHLWAPFIVQQREL